MQQFQDSAAASGPHITRSDFSPQDTRTTKPPLPPSVGEWAQTHRITPDGHILVTTGAHRHLYAELVHVFSTDRRTPETANVATPWYHM
jgi:hypothetical protein